MDESIITPKIYEKKIDICSHLLRIIMIKEFV